MKTKDLKHPMQPIGWNETGDIIRFKANKIVRLLVDTSTLNLNQIAIMNAEGKFDDGDYAQLMQLIGYSVNGFGDLELSDEITKKADQIAAELIAQEKETIMPEFYLSDDKATACMKLDETHELFVRKVNDGLVIDVFDSAAIEINGPTFSLFIKNSQLKQTIEDLKSIK